MHRGRKNGSQKNKRRASGRGSGLPGLLEIACSKPCPRCDLRYQDNTVDDQTLRRQGYRRSHSTSPKNPVYNEPPTTVLDKSMREAIAFSVAGQWLVYLGNPRRASPKLGVGQRADRMRMLD